jgi:hypothetical protein
LNILTVNESWRLARWADVAYGCDGSWWKLRRGLPGFAGTKLAHDTDVCARYRDVHKIEVQGHDRMLFDDPGVIGSGGNSTSLRSSEQRRSCWSGSICILRTGCIGMAGTAMI